LATSWSAGNFYNFFIEFFWFWHYVYDIVFDTVFLQYVLFVSGVFEYTFYLTISIYTVHLTPNSQPYLLYVCKSNKNEFFSKHFQYIYFCKSRKVYFSAGSYSTTRDLVCVLNFLFDGHHNDPVQNLSFIVIQNEIFLMLYRRDLFYGCSLKLRVVLVEMKLYFYKS
jgi:hypothetical protein